MLPTNIKHSRKILKLIIMHMRFVCCIKWFVYLYFRLWYTYVSLYSPIILNVWMTTDWLLSYELILNIYLSKYYGMGTLMGEKVHLTKRQSVLLFTCILISTTYMQTHVSKGTSSNKPKPNYTPSTHETQITYDICIVFTFYVWIECGIP